MKVDKSGGPDACWPWMAARVPAGGYGRYLADRLIAAHRYAWIITNGPLDDKEIDVMHTCDNPPCCNPKHLKAVTTAENMRDAFEKRRHAFGERCPRRKLSEAQAREILSLKGTGPATPIALRYGVGVGAVQAIWRGAAWAHIQEAA